MISAHNTDIGLSFYNDKVKEIIPASIIAEPFTYVPIKAGHLELVEGNAIVVGKITEGYDVISLDVRTEISYEEISGATPPIYLSVKPFQTSEIISSDPAGPCFESRTLIGVLVINLPYKVYEDNTYFVDVSNVVEGFDLSAFYVANVGDTQADVKTQLELGMAAAGMEVVAGSPDDQIYMYERSYTFCYEPYVAGTIDTIFEKFVATARILYFGLSTKSPQLKSGSSQGFGIVYKDRSGRTCSVIKNSNMQVYIPFYAEEALNLLDTIPKLVFNIWHKPPTDRNGVRWAKTYEIVWFGNLSMEYWLQIRASDITSLGNNRYAININDTFEWTWDKNNRWKVDAYSWIPGDRIRLIGSIAAAGGIVTKYDILYDYEIEETNSKHGDSIGAGDYLICQALDRPDSFGNETTIENATDDLDGTVALTQADAEEVERIDTVTLTGTGGTANIVCGNLEKVATFNGTLTQTATDFASDNFVAYAAIGITVTSLNAGIIFTAAVAGVDFPSAVNIIMEIYRPRKGLSQTAAYGTGMVFDIATDENGFEYHKGDIDQVLNVAGAVDVPASVDNTANDSWKFLRLNYRDETESIQPFWAESLFPSDWWNGQDINRKLTSVGFPFLDDLSQRQTELDERIRHGGFLISGTRTNNIAHFTFDDYVDLKKNNGDITGLREIGYTLKVIQLHKETSIYIQRIQTFNPDGTEQFTLTDRFLGTVRPMDDNYGCQHPDSIMVNGRNLYYWDNTEGEFIRSAPNGQIAISRPDYKMSRWFKDTLRWIETSGGRQLLEVRVGANNDFEEVWLTFRMGTEVRGVIFSEKNRRFISRLNQITEAYVHLGNFFAHFYHQRIWIMNVDEGQDYLSWSGSPTYAELEVVSNVEDKKNKIFNAIAIFADHLLQSLSKYVYIPADSSGSGDLMESNIPIFDRREGIYFGEILKDENSPGTFASVNDKKMNGRAMRGRHCFVKLKTEEHDEKVRVDAVVIFSTPSERNV